MNRYMKGVVCSAASLIVVYGFAAKSSTFFSVGATVQAEAYYCTGDALSQTCSNTPDKLIPQNPQVSDVAVLSFDSQDPGNVGAVLPDKLWEYVSGNDVPAVGLVLKPSVLKGEKDAAQKIPVSAYYVPCGTAPSSDGTISGVPSGAILKENVATSIAHDGKSCGQGGNIYLVFNTTNVLTSDGFVKPDSYTGDLNLDMEELSSGTGT